MASHLKLSLQSLNTLFAQIADDDHRVLWIRDPSYSEQLYLSKGFESIWKRSCDNLYNMPEDWNRYLAIKDGEVFSNQLKQRKPDHESNQQNDNVVYYQIYDALGNRQFIRDSTMYLYDNDKYVAVAGIAESIPEQLWTINVHNGVDTDNEQLFDTKNNIAKIIEEKLQLSPHETTEPQPSHEKLKQKITKREMECLNYLAKGYTSKQIARSMYLSPRTVECHINNMREKFSCATRTELVALLSNYIN